MINDNYTKNFITKEEFITMITNLNFVAIEECQIEFITAFLLDTEKDTISPKGFKITII